MKISPNDDNTWTEVAPPAAGIKADRLEKVAHWLASRLRDGHFGAQLVVLRGRHVDRVRGAELVSIGVHQLVPDDDFPAQAARAGELRSAFRTEAKLTAPSKSSPL